VSIKFSTEDKEDFLLITTHGESTEAKVVLKYAGNVVKCCKKSKHSSILIDERDRKYYLTDVLDQNRMANFLSSMDIADLRIAFICQQKYQEQVHFLETAAQNRGLTIRFFIDLDSAEKWLA